MFTTPQWVTLLVIATLVHGDLVFVHGEADLRSGVARPVGSVRLCPRPEFLRDRRMVYWLSPHQFVQPCQFRAQIARLQSACREAHHQHDLSLAASFEI